MHSSFWIEDAPAPREEPLVGDARADVAVIGAGIAGLTAAVHLARNGKDVVVLERDRIAHGVSGKTTAKVTLQHGLFYHSLVQRYGRERALIHVKANLAGKAFLEEVQGSGSAGFTPASSYVYTTDAGKLDTLRKEADAARDLDLPATFLDGPDVTELPFTVAGAVRFEGQGHFHPMLHLRDLVTLGKKLGVRYHEHSPVVGLKDGEPCRIKTASGAVSATHVLVTTNVPINEKSFYVLRMEPRREYVAMAKVERPMRGMYVNCDEPRRSVRPYRDGQDWLVLAGESHGVGKGSDTQRHYAALDEFAASFAPMGIGEVEYRWSTQDYYPVDEVPMVGRYGATSKHTYTATGFRAWGMTMGTAAGIMLGDLVLHGKSPWSDLYDPFRAHRLLDALKEPKQYKLASTAVEGLVGSRLRTSHMEDLAPGEGKVVDEGMHKVAVARARDGSVHACRAACSHMGCIVAWNGAEESWDCPCHGSRFAIDGRVLRGPATEDLAPAETPTIKSV